MAKPHCEKNHEYIRKICPKGTSFDSYTQDDINLMMSRINSAARQSLGGMSPMALAKLTLPPKLLSHFGLIEIPADETVLTPALLKNKPEHLKKSADMSHHTSQRDRWNLLFRSSLEEKVEN